MCAKCSPRLSSHPPDDSEQFTHENLGGFGLQRKNAQRVRAEVERLWICPEGAWRRPPKSPVGDKYEKWDGSRKKSLFWDASGNQNFIVNFGGDLLWRTSEGWAYAQEFPKGSGVSPRNHGGFGRKRPQPRTLLYRRRVRRFWSYGRPGARRFEDLQLLPTALLPLTFACISLNN